MLLALILCLCFRSVPLRRYKHSVKLTFMDPCIMIQFLQNDQKDATLYDNLFLLKKMQLCTIIYFYLTVLHVSSDVYAHHQKHLNCNFSFWFYSRVSLSAAVMTAADDDTRE